MQQFVTLVDIAFLVLFLIDIEEIKKTQNPSSLIIKEKKEKVCLIDYSKPIKQ